MIKGKEGGTYNSDHQLFIYGDSPDKWKDVEAYYEDTESENQNLIINTTPQQILIVKVLYPNLYKQLKKIFVFIDEIDKYAKEVSFRESLGEFMELLFLI